MPVVQEIVRDLGVAQARGLPPHAPDLERVAEAKRGDNCGSRGTPGEQRVERHGRAMAEAFDARAEVAEVEVVGACRQFKRCHDAAHDIGRGRRFEHARLAASVGHPQIREGAAHVGPDKEGHALSGSVVDVGWARAALLSMITIAHPAYNNSAPQTATVARYPSRLRCDKLGNMKGSHVMLRLRAVHPEWLSEKKVTVLVQY